MYILKKGRGNTRSLNPVKYEDKLLGIDGRPGMIERGALTDGDINFILQSGDSRLKNALNQKYRREKKNAAHVQRMHGDVFTNKDNDGNLFKDIDTSFNPSDYDSEKAPEIKRAHDSEFGSAHPGSAQSSADG